MISSAEQRGEQRGRIQIARALLDILDDEMIAAKTGLELQEVKKLRSEKDR